MRVTIFLAATVVILATATAHSSENGDNHSKRVDAIFADYDRPDSPGCAVGIIRKGKLIYSKGFGSANLEYQTPITEKTVFEIASFSKSFTTVCIAILMDQGKLKPHDDIRVYLPEIHAFDPPITVIHLLRCQSGIRDYIHLMPLAGWPLEPGWVAYTEDDVINILAAQRTLQFTPGSKFGYSNSDYFLLGQVVERASGKSLADFARENIFEPLGMSRTQFADRPAQVMNKRAVGYEPRKGGWNAWFTSGSVMGACGVRTCIEDLQRWDQNFYDSKLPRGKYLDGFFREGELLDNRICLDAERADRYRGAKRMQFTGGGWGSVSAMSRYPDERFTVICLSNHDLIVPWEANRKIADLYLPESLSPIKANEQTQPKVSAKVVNSHPPLSKDLPLLAGSYIDSIDRVRHVSFDGKQLTYTHDKGETFTLTSVDNGDYRPLDYPYGDDTFRFERRPPDGPWTMIIQWATGSTKFTKFEAPVLSPQELSEFIGDFTSDELNAKYNFRVADAKLMLQVNNLAWEELTPIARDQFVPRHPHTYDARVIKFQRNLKGSVCGFEIGSHRAQGTRLVKK